MRLRATLATLALAAALSTPGTLQPASPGACRWIVRRATVTQVEGRAPRYWIVVRLVGSKVLAGAVSARPRRVGQSVIIAGCAGPADTLMGWAIVL